MLASHKSEVHALAANPMVVTTVASGSVSGMVVWYDTGRLEIQQTAIQCGAAVRALRYAPLGRCLIAGLDY